MDRRGILPFFLVVPFACSTLAALAGEPADRIEIALPGEELTSHAFSPDGRLLATGFEKSPPIVWDASIGTRMRGLKAAGKKAESIERLRWSPDGRRIAGLARDDKRATRIILWTAESGDVQAALGDGASNMAFASPDRIVAVFPGDKALRIWDARTGEKLGETRLEIQPAGLSYSPDGKRIAVAAGHDPSNTLNEILGKPNPRPVALFDAQTLKKAGEFGNPGQAAVLVAFSPDGRRIAFGDYPCKVFEAETSKKVVLVPDMTFGFSHDGKRIGCERGIFEIETGRRVAVIPSPEGPGWDALDGSFSPDGARLAFVASGVARVWRLDRLPAAPGPKAAARPAKEARSTGDPALDAIPVRLESVRFRVWNSITHAAEDRKAADAALGILEALRKIVEGDRSGVDAAGGLAAIEKDLLQLAKSHDRVVSSGAILLMGAIGDVALAPGLAKIAEGGTGLLRKTLGGERDGDAACALIALGMMKARGEAPRIARLLGNRSEPRRAAAAIALGMMGSKEHVEAIARLLDDPSQEVRMSAAQALAELGAREYVPRFARLLGERSSFEAKKTAIRMLVTFEAKECSRDIAELLDEPACAGSAAAALALFGAKEHATAIAGLIGSDKPIEHELILLALGVLRAGEFEDEVAGRLDAGSTQEIRAAAFSLVLMESKAHGQRAAQRIDEWFDGEIDDGLFRDWPSTTETKAALGRRALDSLERLRRN